MRKSHQEQQRFQHFWREVVYQAVRDLMLKDEATPLERRNAREWVFADADGPASFVWACVVAGLDPEAVRKELRDRGIE